MTNVYLDEADRLALTAFSMWNRDPASPSAGGFDRPFWGWKFKDFPDATLQYAVRLCIDWAERRGCQLAIREWLLAYVRYCSAIQHRDGSFDQCYPNERTPGVVLDFLSTLVAVRSLEWLGPSRELAQLDAVIARAAAFATETTEDHGNVANHFAEYAYELFAYAARYDDERARRKGREYVERLMSAFRPQEGWFEEYGGADPGYQSRCLSYLTRIAGLLESNELWSAAAQSAAFVDQLMMPDHSLHPMLGSRSTALLYPLGFELLSKRDAAFRRVAARVREAWRTRSVPLPAAIDFGNPNRLATDALDAGRAAAGEAEEALPELPPLPRDFPEAGLLIRRSPDSAVYVAWRLGGSVVAYRRVEDRWTLAGEEAGYLLHREGSGERLVSRAPGTGVLEPGSAAGEIHVRAGFRAVLHEDLTPVKMLLLRLLNLTVLRSAWLGDLFRRLVAKRLIERRREAPLRLSRRILISEHEVRISDRLSGHEADFEAGGISLLRCRRVTGIHMASSRYFQPGEALTEAGPWTEEVQPQADGSLPERCISLKGASH